MELIDIWNYISLKYLIVVILLIETIKKYFPVIMKTLHSKWIIFVLCMVVAVFMFVYDVHVIHVKDVHECASKLFISFMFTICFYSLIVKPTIQSIKAKFGNPKEDAQAD